VTRDPLRKVGKLESWKGNNDDANLSIDVAQRKKKKIDNYLETFLLVS